MEMNISAHEPALVIEDVVKRFNVASEHWWHQLLRRKGDRSSANGQRANGQGTNRQGTNRQGTNRQGANGHSADGTADAPKARRGKHLVTAVDHVSFDVQRHEIFGVLGSNGSGKSTLIRLLSTLLVPDEGRILVFGLDATQHEMQIKRLINRVSVDAAFFKKLSPRENLLYGARLYGVSGKEADRKAREILKRLGLKDSSYGEPMEDMSRGMQQKVAIARAFLTQPIMLLLDEPTTGLDPRSKLEVQSFINELRDVHDATILITTHDMNEADALCDRIAILDDGKIVAMDTPDNLKTLVRRNGHEPTLEEVFMQLTGKELIEKDDVDDFQPDKVLSD